MLQLFPPSYFDLFYIFFQVVVIAKPLLCLYLQEGVNLHVGRGKPRLLVTREAVRVDLTPLARDGGGEQCRHDERHEVREVRVQPENNSNDKRRCYEQSSTRPSPACGECGPQQQQQMLL